MNIGFFDSGIGGITVLYQALKLLPQENYIYYADTRHVPYGEKTKDEVRNFVFQAADFIASQNVKALVIACNSATSAAVKELRNKYSFPILGIEPAVKPAIKKSLEKGRRVLVLATNLTLKEEKYTSLVTQLDNEGIVDGLALPGLVEFAEKLQFDEKVIMPYFMRQLAPFDFNQYETIVLGCTHFPFYKDMLEKLLPEHIDIIDGGIGTARNLKRIMEETQITNEGTGKIIYYQTGVKVEDQSTLAQYDGLLSRLARIYS